VLFAFEHCYSSAIISILTKYRYIINAWLYEHSHCHRLLPLASEPSGLALERRLGIRRVLLRSLDLDESESDELDRELLESESESETELESLESESESDVDDDLLAFLRELSFSFPFTSLVRSFSFASSILSAVPTLFLNSSGTSTEGFPSAFSLANNRGFSSC